LGADFRFVAAIGFLIVARPRGLVSRRIIDFMTASTAASAAAIAAAVAALTAIFCTRATPDLAARAIVLRDLFLAIHVLWVTPCCNSRCAEKYEDDDETDRYSKEPKKDWHDQLLTTVAEVGPFSYQRAFRSFPPSAAARLADNAPASSEMAIQIENLAAARRALSAASFACAIV